MRTKTLLTTATVALGASIALALAAPASGSEKKDPAPNKVPTSCVVYLDEIDLDDPLKVTPSFVDLYDAELIGRTIWGEAGGVASETERAAVAWCILNRVDAWDLTIEDVVTAPEQFHGYRALGECPQEHIELAIDVLTRYAREKNGETDVGRVLPEGYLYFVGDGVRNHFTEEWKSKTYYDWSNYSPYND